MHLMKFPKTMSERFPAVSNGGPKPTPVASNTRVRDRRGDDRGGLFAGTPRLLGRPVDQIDDDFRQLRELHRHIR